MPPTESIVYKATTDAAGEAVALRLHVFAPRGHTRGDHRAAIVFFHGSAWVTGEPEQFFPHGAYFASRGMLAMSAEYRIGNKHGTTPFECVADGRSAMRYVRANATALGVDPDRIVAAGASAGGHVAAATATLPGLDSPGEDTSVSCVPTAMVLFNPVLNCGPGGWGYERVRDRYREISPAHNIRPGLPPTILFHGTADAAVSFADAEAFARAMTAAGNRCELVPFAGANHGFFNYALPDNAAYHQTVCAADVFLASLGFIEGEPTIAKKDAGPPA